MRDVPARQRVLETLNVLERLRLVHEILTRENEVLALGKRLQDEIRDKIEKQQKQFFLREQLKLLKKELGEEKDREDRDRDEYDAKIREAKMPEEVEKKAREELDRLAIIPQEASEYAVVRNYLDWLCSIPWSKSAPEANDPNYAERILNQDHYGLEEVKDRIVEFIGVRRLRPDKPGPILCLVGPPGVGKTSLGRSIARATKRPFVRSALGGMRDEAEIRGHRRTYVGALPGRIVQELKNAKVNNPVFLLDEIDKLGSDFRGDPSSALLEVLDPEQNKIFRDHYLDVPVDLSRDPLRHDGQHARHDPAGAARSFGGDRDPGLRDRGESSHRAALFVTSPAGGPRPHGQGPGAPGEHGAGDHRGYTREAGVRSLEKRIEKITRRRALAKARAPRRARKLGSVVAPEDLAGYLGPPSISRTATARRNRPASPWGSPGRGLAATFSRSRRPDGKERET